MAQIDLDTGAATIIARDLPISSFTDAFNETAGFERNASGNFYLTNGDGIVKYDPVTRAITSVAGVFHNASAATGAELGDGGPASNAILSAPRAVRADTAGNLFIADSGNHRIRFISAATGIISTIAGSSGAGCPNIDLPLEQALFTTPSDLALDAAGNLFVADSACAQVFRLSLDPPVLIAPANGSNLGPFSGNTLSWGPTTGATSYDVLFGIGTAPPLPRVAKVTSTSYTFPPLSPGSLYSWQIVANGSGTAASPVYTFTAGSGCVASIALTSNRVFPMGGTGTITVDAADTCGWAAGTDSSWITLTPPASGMGKGTVNFTVSDVPGTAARSGTISIGGLVLTIDQPGQR